MARYIKPIVMISNPSRGIASHPLNGFGHIRNLDITTNPGSIRLNCPLVKQSSTTVTGQILWQRTDPATGKVYAIDDAGVVYNSNNSGGGWATIVGNSGGTGGGLEIWKNYLITIGTSGLDAYNLASPGWTNNFTGSSLDFTQSQPYSPILKSVDGCLYIGNGKYVDKLKELTTFAPGTGATFQYTSKAITLADNYQITSIRDLGSNLMIGTLYLNSNTIADLFPYDRSTLTLGVPIRIVEKGIKAMYNYGNRLYILAGVTGKMFITDGVSAPQIIQIPNYIINLDGGSVLTMFPDAIMYLKGKIWFGISNSTLGNAGVWSYNLSTKALQMENTISTGNDGSSNALYISSLQPLGVDSYLAAWKDSTTYGVDLLSNNTRYTSYLGYIDSPLVDIGEIQSFTETGYLEFTLLKPLTSGQGLKLQYRKDLASSFTDIVTFDFTTLSGIVSKKILLTTIVKNVVMLQIRALLTSGGSNTPELANVTIIQHEYNM